MHFNIYVGCDIGKATFSFCIRNQSEILEEGQIVNKQRPIRSWLKSLKKKYVSSGFIIGMEHTGIYSYILLREAHGFDISCSVDNARNIKMSLGLRRGKNDRVDAQRIAEYMLRYSDKLKVWSPRKKQVKQLQVLIARRRQLVKARKILIQFEKESVQFLDSDVVSLIQKDQLQSLTALTLDIDRIEKLINEVLLSDENLKRLKMVITSVPGVGLLTCCELILRTNEFKNYASAKKLACTAGVAPFEHSSGSSLRGKTRVSSSAHKPLKTLLHLCAMAAIRKPGEIQDYYQRKVEEGKNKMSVLNAVRNKLIHRVFAVVKNNVMYKQNYSYSLA